MPAGRPKKTTATVASASASPLPPSDQTYFTQREAASYLRATPRFVGDSIRDGRLPKLVMGRRFILQREALDTFARSLKAA